MEIPYSARFQFPVTHAAAPVMDAVLARAKNVSQAGGMPVVLFDLDGTLFDNGPRTWQILYEFSQATNRPDLAHGLQRLPKLQLPYTLGDILRLLKQDDPQTLAQALEFWKARFFVDHYILHDEPVAGARLFCQRLWDAGCTLVYFSGRDAPNMLVGTTQSLRTHGFPVGLVRTVITLKERFEKEDLVFKREALNHLKTLGQVVGAFDNEPANCNLFHQHFPQAESVAVATSHAPQPEKLLPAIKVVADFST